MKKRWWLFFLAVLSLNQDNNYYLLQPFTIWWDTGKTSPALRTYIMCHFSRCQSLNRLTQDFLYWRKCSVWGKQHHTVKIMQWRIRSSKKCGTQIHQVLLHRGMCLYVFLSYYWWYYWWLILMGQYHSAVDCLCIKIYTLYKQHIS